MNLRGKTKKGLLILTCLVLAGLFFARTVQTAATAKVQIITATRGKLDDTITVPGEIRFSNSEPFTIKGAGTLNLVVDKVMARAGYLIKPGDVLFTGSVPDFEDKLKELRLAYEKKVRERTEAVAGSLRILQTSEQNDYYNAMVKATDVYWDKLFKAKAAAIAAGHELSDDPNEWNLPPAGTAEDTQAVQAGPRTQEEFGGGDDEPEVNMKAAMREALDAMRKKDEASVLFKSFYTGNRRPAPKVSGDVFDYIKKIDGMNEEIHGYLDEMLELEKLKLRLQAIRADREGWLTEFDLKAGDRYDGSKPAYALSAPGELPVLRCDITDISKRESISKGMKARVQGAEREMTISGVEEAADGKTYAIIELDESNISALGGLSRLMSEKPSVSILYKSPKTATLLPLTALRDGGDDRYYVYVIDQDRDGILGNSTFTVKKREVTVIETSARLAAVGDDLSELQIADREDRTLSEGQAVMEYVDVN
ncbi:MAG: hypothetical protein EOM58_00365 [Clostridia bacterium]|nr:hypothetical protein [Clostridia bacterium]